MDSSYFGGHLKSRPIGVNMLVFYKAVDINLKFGAYLMIFNVLRRLWEKHQSKHPNWTTVLPMVEII